MKREVLSDFQGICLIVMFLGGTTSLLTLGIKSKQDYWLAIVIAVIVSVPIFLLYARLHYLYPHKNFLDIIEICLGKILGKVVMILFTLFCFDEGTEVLINSSQFISSTSLMETPRIVLSISMMLVCVWVAKAGIEVLGRWGSLMILPFLTIILFSQILLIPSMNFSNFLPAFTTDSQTLFFSTLLTFAFPFGEVFTFSIVFTDFKSSKSPYKIYLMGLLFGALIPLIISTGNVLVLGPQNASSYFHPTYFTLRRITIGNLLQRIEVLASLAYIIGTFCKVTIYLFAFSKGLSKIFNFNDYRFIVIPAALLMVNLSHIFLTNMLVYWEYTEKVWIYYALPFELFFPVLIWIVAEIKHKKTIQV